MGNPTKGALENKTQVKIVTDGTDTYICEAGIGFAESESKWAITKIDTNGNITYPQDTDGNPVYAFKFAVTNDATVIAYTYSYN